MKRTAIAAAWLLGATFPLLGAIVFVFGCCALPFHSVIHKVMPVCRLALDVIRGEQANEAQQQAPAREKQEPAKRIATSVPRAVQLAALAAERRAAIAGDASAYRSFISLGAVRCDRDVGLYLLAGTLLI
jgi:hypothetical protein